MDFHQPWCVHWYCGDMFEIVSGQISSILDNSACHMIVVGIIISFFFCVMRCTFQEFRLGTVIEQEKHALLRLSRCCLGPLLYRRLFQVFK